MDMSKAVEQIERAINEYDEGAISRVALSTVVTETLKTMGDAAYSAGMDDADAAHDDDVVEFEAEMDLDDMREDQDDDLPF
jgi:hypothetical protein